MCKKCSECGKESEDLTMVDEVTYVCPDCLDGLYFHCDECDEYWKYGYVTAYFLKDDRILCEYCAEDMIEDGDLTDDDIESIQED